MRSYTKQAMLKRTGLSYRQLDHWTSLGHLHCPDAAAGSGTVRHWSEVEADVAVLMLRLVKTAGFTVDAAAYIARMVAGGRWDTIGLGEGMRLTVDPPADGYAARRGVEGT